MKVWASLIFMLLYSGVSGQYLPKFDIQGHRGARGILPENSIPAFLRALDLGVTTVELDVVISKDKKVVVSHEPWMSAEICLDPDGKAFKNNPAKYNIFQMTYDEIEAFDCGSKENPAYPNQEKFKISKPLLSDVIVAIENHIRNYSLYEVDYNIEIKSTPAGDEKFHPSVKEFSDLVYQLVDQYLPLERVVIQSFDFRVLKYWNKNYPDIRLAVLVDNDESIDQNLARLGFKPAIYSPYYKLLNRDQVSYLHKLRMRVIPWTVNEESEMLVFKGMGVDGFITDYPDRARKYKMTLNIQRK